MPQAVVDPEELRRFAQRLKKFNRELQNQSTLLANQLASLGATWRDQEHKKFLEEFEQQMRVIGRFTEATDQYVPYLIRKAEHIEDYLQS
ncbi:MAG: WXG100 family type VII secretion target [Pirellulaceae bacterium]